jgi:formamidopyrimidine-DNA glycosylase
MPELPEVETTRRGIAPFLEGRRLLSVTVRDARLRWPVSTDFSTGLSGQWVRQVARRAKYLLLHTDAGCAIGHLGMSGSLRVTPPGEPHLKHDHLEFLTDAGVVLRYNDPRRFGCWLWTHDDPLLHPLLAALGPEPLADDLPEDHLWRMAQGRRTAVKPFIMDGQVLVGVGNIYANEALFAAGIHPSRPAQRISRARYMRLQQEIRRILAGAIEQGGTTLRDFVGGDGKPGYFSQQLAVYGRAGEPCRVCGGALRERRLGQRSSVFCAVCQR